MSLVRRQPFSKAGVYAFLTLCTTVLVCMGAQAAYAQEASDLLTTENPGNLATTETAATSELDRSPIATGEIAADSQGERDTDMPGADGEVVDEGQGSKDAAPANPIADAASANDDSIASEGVDSECSEKETSDSGDESSFGESDIKTDDDKQASTQGESEDALCAGNATIALTVRAADVSGTVEASQPIDISKANIVVGDVLCGNLPDIAVSHTSKSGFLKYGKDYTVTFSSVKKKGKGTCTFTGIGSFTGTVTKTFTIYAKPSPGERAIAQLKVIRMPLYSVCESFKNVVLSSDTKGILTIKGTTFTAAKPGVCTLSVSNLLAKSKSPMTEGSHIADVRVLAYKPAGTFVVKSALDTRKALDVSRARTDDTANVQIYQVNGTKAQAFRLVEDRKAYTLVNVNSGKAVDVKGASKASGANVQQYHRNYTVAQRWRIMVDYRSRVTFVNVGSGMALDVAGAKTANSTNVQQYKRNGTLAQVWVLTAADATSTKALTLPAQTKAAGSSSSAVAQSSVDLSEAAISSIRNRVYVGKKIMPSVAVRFDGKSLVKGKDFTLAYKANKNVGTATVIVKGVGAFKGKREATFKISAAQLSNARIAIIAARAFTGSAVKPGLSVTFEDATLKAGTDFSVSFKNNVRPGTATVTISGTGNYKGSKKATFKIQPNYIVISDFYTTKDAGITTAWPDTLARELNLTVGKHKVYCKGLYGFARGGGLKFTNLIKDLPKDAAISDVIILGGTGNDRGYSYAAIKQGYAQTVAMARDKWKNANVMHASPNWHLKNSGYRENMTKRLPWYKEFAKANNVTYLTTPEKIFYGRPDLMRSDGNHPNQKGHDAIAKAVATDMKRIYGYNF